MPDIKAYAIHTIKLGSDSIPASTKDRPSVFDLDQDTFDRLSRLQAARKATKEEIAIWQSQQDDDNGTTNSELQSETGERVPPAQQPESGAANDPKNKPAGKKAAPKAADKTDGDDLGV